MHKQTNIDISELWRPVAGYDGDYWISNLGRVRSVKGNNDRILKSTGAGSYSKSEPDNRYQQVCLCRKGQPIMVRVHKLVADAFMSPRPGRDYRIRFVDGNKGNAAASNLRYQPEVDLIRDVEFGLPEQRAWMVQSPDGERYVVKKPARFAKAYGLNTGTFSGMINRTLRHDGRGGTYQIRSTHGWRLVHEFDRVTGNKTYINSDLSR